MPVHEASHRRLNSRRYSKEETDMRVLSPCADLITSKACSLLSIKSGRYSGSLCPWEPHYLFLSMLSACCQA